MNTATLESRTKFRIPKIITLTLGIILSFIWAGLMMISMAFLVYNEPLSFTDEDFLFRFMLMFYPAIMLVGVIITLKFDDKRGLISFCSVIVPTLVLCGAIFNETRLSIINWDEFASKTEEEFIRQSAFGSAKSLENLIGTVENVNFYGKEGLTPLLAAYKGRNIKTFEYLLKKGANVNFLPNGALQYNIADYIISDNHHDGRSQYYFELLVKNGLDIHIGTKISNLLQSAVMSKHQWYLRYLLENGVDPDRKGTIFLSPVAYATLHQKWENALILVPYSSIDNLTEAAAVFHENRERYWDTNENRDKFEQELIKLEINFDEALDIRKDLREKRLSELQSENLG